MINSKLLELNTDKETPPSVFWSLDSRLPMVAAKAAVEFDWLLQSRKGGEVPGRSVQSIGQLLSFLEKSLEESEPLPENQRFIDSLGLNLLAKAYNKTQDGKLTTREDLQSAVRKLITSLKNAEEGGSLDERELRNTMDFCVALSEYAVAYRRMIYGNRCKHLYQQ